eukprot:569914-Prorocentrum_lima.AAC.1
MQPEWEKPPTLGLRSLALITHASAGKGPMGWLGISSIPMRVSRGSTSRRSWLLGASPQIRADRTF